MRSRRVWNSTLIILLACSLLSAVGLFGYVERGETKTAKRGLPDSVSFPGTGTGAIPDGVVPCTEATPVPGAPLDIQFVVADVTGPLTNVQIALNISHTWVADLDIRLIAPDGTEFVIVSKTEVYADDSCFGDGSNLGGEYVFNDVGGGVNFWDAAFNTGTDAIIPPGAYRATEEGGSIILANAPASETLITPAFAAVNPNGTWILRVVDLNPDDTGTVNSATLSLTGTAQQRIQSHFDFNANGDDDKGVIKDVTNMLVNGQPSPFLAKSYRERLQLQAKAAEALAGSDDGLLPVPGNTMQWWVAPSGTDGPEIHPFGNAITDIAVPADYDGDGEADPAIWRPLNTASPEGAYFMIFRSGDSTVEFVDLGAQGDDPTVVGDYDGDGKADPAVFRCPQAGGQCFYMYRPSAQPPTYGVNFVPLGNGNPQTVFAYPGDFDGDGSYDFCIQTADFRDTSRGMFILLRSGDLQYEWIPFGLSNDFIVPGDYDGDGRNDFAVIRPENGYWRWWILERDLQTQSTLWGTSATDYPAASDYDGDGTTDVGVWRDGFFIYWDRTTGLDVWYRWGDPGDYPINNFQVK